MSINAEARFGRRRVERGIYEQPNGKYMVCFMVDGKPRFRVVGLDLNEARCQREMLVQAAKRGEVAVTTSLRLSSVVERWLVRYEALVAADLRRPRTLEAHRYYLDGHLLPRLGRRRVSAITADDVCDLVAGMRATGCSEKTIANVLATLHGVLRFARRKGWVVDDPIAKLEFDERPRPQPRRQRVLGRDEVVRLLACADEQYRPLVATALSPGCGSPSCSGSTGTMSTSTPGRSTSEHSSPAHVPVLPLSGYRRRRERQCATSRWSATRRDAAHDARGRLGSDGQLGLRVAGRDAAWAPQRAAPRSGPGCRARRS
jgi:Phage integrase, N-terminal SAM-like domain